MPNLRSADDAGGGRQAREVLLQLRMLGDLEYRLGNLDGAMEVALQLKTRFPSDAAGHLLEGRVLVDQQRDAEAFRAYRAAYEIAADGSTLQAAVFAARRAGIAEWESLLRSRLVAAPDDVGARVRAAGGVTDDQVVGDAKGAAAWLRARPEANGKVGVIGFCSGGRHAFLAACRAPEFDALVDCWGGNVIVDDPKLLNAKRSVAPIDLTDKIACPILGLFGNDDENPNADQVNRTEAVLKKLGKDYTFHRYDGAGHAFFNASWVAYRAEQAADGWAKTFAFFHKHLG